MILEEAIKQVSGESERTKDISIILTVILLKILLIPLSIFKIGSKKLSADHATTLHSVLLWFDKFKKPYASRSTASC